MSQPSPANISQIAKKLDPYKIVIVGICAIIVSLGSIAALGSRYTGALDKKADVKDVVELKTSQAADKAVHDKLEQRFDRLEDKVDRNHDDVMNAIDELKALMRHR